jgi:starch synthase
MGGGGGIDISSPGPYHRFEMPNGKLRVAFVTPEVAPFAKSGELADVAASLPKALTALGLEVSLFMPKYRWPEVEALPAELLVSDLPVPLGGKKAKVSVFRAELGKSILYLIDNPKYFLREHIYGPSKGAYLDNDERFVFFNRAVLEFMVKAGIQPDVIHCNNWSAALIPAFLNTHYARRKQFRGTATVLTLHNVAYQGEFPADSLSLTGLTWNEFASHRLAFDGKFNFLKAGVIFADAINTVSHVYREEILDGRQGNGLRDILAGRNRVLHAILNGVDYEEWNSETDPFIASGFRAGNFAGKKLCKADLVREFGLKLPAKAPLFGIVSFLSRHKGFDLLKDSIRELMALEAGLVVLGRGDDTYMDLFREIQADYPGRAAVRFEVSPVLSHKVIAGSDMLLVPSLYEPCGLSQLYAFRYGTVPVVRKTGGLQETVVPFEPGTPGGNGFAFEEFTPEALSACLKKAVSCYSRPDCWRLIMENGFRQDFSWEASSGEYAKLYEKSLSIRKGGTHVQ